MELFIYTAIKTSCDLLSLISVVNTRACSPGTLPILNITSMADVILEMSDQKVLARVNVNTFAILLPTNICFSLIQVTKCVFTPSFKDSVLLVLIFIIKLGGVFGED